jgi:hypothetical protein
MCSVNMHRWMLLASTAFLVVQDQIGAKLHLELQIKANIGNFFTIELPLESTDQALFSGLLRLNEA